MTTQPHPSSLTVKPRILQPLMLLPREHLPLSALDLSQPHGDFPSSRLFESKIKILDLEGRMGLSVLLARSETTGMMYAIENGNSSNGLYVLCKLGAWVDIEQLSKKAIVVCRERLKPKKQVNTEETNLPLTTPLLYKENKRRRLAIEEIQNIVSNKRAESQTARSRASSVVGERPPSVLGDARIPPEVSLPKYESQAAGRSSSSAPPPAPAPAESVAPSSRPAKASVQGAAQEDDPFAQPSAEEMFQIIRTQYMEALYHSKVCLRSIPFDRNNTDFGRVHWHTSQKAPSQGPELPSSTAPTRSFLCRISLISSGALSLIQCSSTRSIVRRSLR